LPLGFYSFGAGILLFEPAGLGIGTWFVDFVVPPGWLFWDPGFWFGTVDWLDDLLGTGDGGFDCWEVPLPDGFLFWFVPGARAGWLDCWTGVVGGFEFYFCSSNYFFMIS
jgi:hypothetical protein